MSKIIFELVLQDVNAQQAISKFRQEVKEANAEIKKGVGGDRFKELTEKITTAKIETLKLTEEQKKLRKEFAATQVPTDSLTGLRIAYSQVTEQVNKLSKAERESDFGQNLIKKGYGLKNQINGIEESLGRFTGNVGNYKKALLSIGDIVTGGLATGGIIAGVQAVAGVMKVGFEQAVKYEQGLADLSALTGVTGKGLEQLKGVEQGLRNIEVAGVGIVNTGPDILNALKLVGGARPELLENAAALGAVTKEAIVLAQASGDGLEPSVKALTTILGQFKLEASESKRVINELAAGAQFGAAEIPQITDSLKEFGTVAEISNIKTSESVALVEVLADRQLKGAEAGTQLRNVFSKLASADILPKSAQEQFKKLGIDVNVLKDSALPLETRLKELGKAEGDLSALTKIFGLENLQAATIITSSLKPLEDGRSKYQQLAEAVQGTNSAYEQAAIRADTLGTKLTNLKNDALNSLQSQFEGTTSSGNQLIGFFDFLVNKLDIVGLAFNAAIGPTKVLLDRFNEVSNFFSGGPEKPKGLQGLDVNALKSTVDLVTGELKPAVEDTTTALLEQANSLVELGKAAEDADGKSDGLKDKTKATKKEAEAAAGSIKFFQDQISALKSQLEKTDADSPLVKKLIQDIQTAEKALVAVQTKIERIKNPIKGFAPKQGTDTPGEAAPVELGVSVDVAGAEDQAIKDLEKLGDALGQQTIKVPVSADTDQLQKDVEDAIENDNKRRKKKKEEREELKDLSIGAASEIASGVAAIQEAQLKRETDAKFEALDEEYEKKRKAAQGNTVLLEKLDKEQAKKKEAIEKQAAAKRKKIALTEAIIQGALSVVKSLPNLVLAAFAALAAGVQIAVISKQEFAGGGVVKKLGPGIINEPANHPTTARGDNVHVLVKSGEMILNEEQQRELKRRAGFDIFHRIGVPMHGVTNKLVPQFASGGLVQDFTPQIALPSGSNAQPVIIQTVAEISDEQMNMLAARIATQTGRATKQGVGEGLEDNNRLQERQASLIRNREA